MLVINAENDGKKDVIIIDENNNSTYIGEIVNQKLMCNMDVLQNVSSRYLKEIAAALNA
jgi:hypothetical protein